MTGTGSRVRLTLAAIALVALVGCAETVRNHGFVPAEEELAALTIGKDTRETVAFKVGRPTTGGVMADGNWYYVQSRWVTQGPRAAKETDRQVLAISFDSQNRLANIERFGLQDGRIVAISRRVTETGVESSGFLRQMIGNLGRINPGRFLD